ncbi:F0F1 ATP synthase subunit gamma [Candidatus Curtissbacteria bacterium]|nr:F0F1 ATP synthase subunit gamma [Candidatus Curtissbacteria bacterium]
MAQIREIKRRIKSINSTAKVTHAMELISAAKMRKAQESALSSRPYTINLNQILAELRQKTKNTSHKLLLENQAEKTMVIMLTTDRGFVGGLNINLFREIAKSEKSKPYH